MKTLCYVLCLLTGFCLLPQARVQAQELVLGTVCQDDIDKLVTQGAEYQPGVNVAGEAVTPADLNAPVKAISYPIEIPVEISLIKWMNLNVDPALKLDPEVARFVLHENGDITYNGQNVSDRVRLCDAQDKAQLVQQAGDSTAADQTETKDTGKSSGQAPKDDIVSSPIPLQPAAKKSVKAKPAQAPSGELLKGEAE